VTRKDFATLTALVESALKACDGRTSAIASPERAAGTGLVKAIQWAAEQPGLKIVITDGINTIGASPTEDFLRALDRLPAEARTGLWLIGLDEGVRDGIARRVPHAAGIFDLQTTTQQLTEMIMRRAN